MMPYGRNYDPPDGWDSPILGTVTIPPAPAGWWSSGQPASNGQGPPPFSASVMLRSQLADIPPVEPLIDGVVSLRSAVVLVGATGAGKTFLALSWACSVGTGHNWLGHGVRQVPVLYTVGEGANGLHARISAWEQAWGTTVTDDQVVFSVRPASLAAETTWTELLGEARTRRCRFIVLDTFSSLAPDADETRHAPLILRRMADLAAALDGTVLLVHHPGWGDTTRARGGSQLESNADEVLVLHGCGTSDLVELERKKVKEGRTGERQWLRRRPMYDSVIIESATAADSEVPLRDTVLAILTAIGEVGATGPQLLKELSMEDKRSTVYKVLAGLTREQAVTKEGPRGRERYRVVTPS
jgi:hypothetical protein